MGEIGRRYATSVVLSRDKGDIHETQHVLDVVSSDSDDAALGQAVRYAHQQYPPESGWWIISALTMDVEADR